MIYKKDGTAQNYGYSVNGSNLSEAYDINGRELLDKNYDIVVMSYNYQWCYKINSQLTMQQAIIDLYDADIIGIQEACKRSDVQNRVRIGSFPNIANVFLSGYEYKQLSVEATNKNAMVSKLPMVGYENILYTEDDDETWDYQKCYIVVGGKTVAWYNTHLTWRDDAATLERKYAQMAELRAAVSQEQYAIITGDFNFYGSAAGDTEYNRMYKPFVDEGFKLANVQHGTQNTFTLSTTATSLSELSTCTDNIIVSGNIDIVNVVYDTTKFSYLNGDPIDHIAMTAYLAVK